MFVHSISGSMIKKCLTINRTNLMTSVARRLPFKGPIYISFKVLHYPDKSEVGPIWVSITRASSPPATPQLRLARVPLRARALRRFANQLRDVQHQVKALKSKLGSKLRKRAVQPA